MTPAPAQTSAFPAGPSPARGAVAASVAGGRAVQTTRRALFLAPPLALASIPATATDEGLTAVDAGTGHAAERRARLGRVPATPDLPGDRNGVTFTQKALALANTAIRAEMPGAIPSHRISTARMSYNPEVLQ